MSVVGAEFLSVLHELHTLHDFPLGDPIQVPSMPSSPAAGTTDDRGGPGGTAVGHEAGDVGTEDIVQQQHATDANPATVPVAPQAGTATAHAATGQAQQQAETTAGEGTATATAAANREATAAEATDMLTPEYVWPDFFNTCEDYVLGARIHPRTFIQASMWHTRMHSEVTSLVSLGVHGPDAHKDPLAACPVCAHIPQGKPLARCREIGHACAGSTHNSTLGGL